MNDKVIIGESCDGWSVQVKGKEYSWNHNETDMGTVALKEMLEDLGFEVTIEEWY